MRGDQTFIHQEFCEATLQIWRQAINIAKYECKVALVSENKIYIYLDVIIQWICSSFFVFWHSWVYNFLHRG